MVKARTDGLGGISITQYLVEVIARNVGIPPDNLVSQRHRRRGRFKAISPEQWDASGMGPIDRETLRRRRHVVTFRLEPLVKVAIARRAADRGMTLSALLLLWVATDLATTSTVLASAVSPRPPGASSIVAPPSGKRRRPALPHADMPQRLAKAVEERRRERDAMYVE